MKSITESLKYINILNITTAKCFVYEQKLTICACYNQILKQWIYRLFKSTGNFQKCKAIFFLLYTIQITNILTSLNKTENIHIATSVQLVSSVVLFLKHLKQPRVQTGKHEPVCPAGRFCNFFIWSQKHLSLLAMLQNECALCVFLKQQSVYIATNSL